MLEKKHSVYGIGNPLLDLIINGSYEKLKELGSVPGSMNLVDTDFQGRVLSGCTVSTRSPGGSCANTLRGLAWLGRQGGDVFPPCYTGAVGTDNEGKIFEDTLAAEGVEPSLAFKSDPTGTSAIIVTPDSERTMYTNLSACRRLDIDDVDISKLLDSAFFHTTGYMWDTENQMEAAKNTAYRAKERGVKVSFDIADPFVVDRYRQDLVAWIPGNVDVLFANRDEMKMLTGCTDCDSDVILKASRFAPLVVMKVGKDGCLIQEDGRVTEVAGEKVDCIDTTGAGDAFAGGFLYGLCAGFSIRECGIIANRIAASIVTISGCSFEGLPKIEIP